MNYLARPPPSVVEYYYEEDSYAINEQTGGFWPNGQGSNQENWIQGQRSQGQNYGNYNRQDHYVRDGYYNRKNNFNRGNYGKKNDRSWPYVPPQNREVAPREGGGSMARVEDMLQKMRRRFDASDEHPKELRGDLSNTGQNVEAHAMSV